MVQLRKQYLNCMNQTMHTAVQYLYNDVTNFQAFCESEN